MILLASGAHYSVRNARRPALSSIVNAKPVVHSICVEPVQNLSHKPARMDGVDDELVAQLHKVGFESREVSDRGKCDAIM